MTPIRTVLITALALSCATPAFADELTHGISSAQTEGVRYLASTTSTSNQGRKIKDGAGSDLKGTTRARRVSFDYEGDEVDAPFEVRGILFGWNNLQVARFRVADLEEAVLFSNHDREDSDAPRVIEVRGRTVLVIWGEDADDADLVSEVRALAWPSNAQKRVDVLAYQEDMDNLFYRFSQEAIDASPFLEAQFDQQGSMLDALANMDPGADLTVDGDSKRLVSDGAVITASDRSLGLYESEAKETAFAKLIDALDPPAASSTTADSGGLTGALSGASGSPLPDEILAAHDGATFKAKVDDEIVIDLAGNPSTGYRWRQVGNPTQVELVDDEFYMPSGPGPVGSGGRFAFTYRARSKGTQVLKLEYSRGGGAAAETFSVTIVVR